MDIFKQNHYLVLVVILLVILNLTTLLMLWLGRPPQPATPREGGGREREQAQIQRLLKDELGFEKKQAEQYLILRQEHSERVRQLNEEIRQIKRQMFDEVLQGDSQPTLSDSLLNLAQEKQAQIEQLTFKHFLDLKKLCKPEQQGKLRLLMNELFRKQQPGMDIPHPPPPPNGVPPHPPENR